MFASGKSATIPFTRGNLFKIVPNKLVINNRSRGPGDWLYCTTTAACFADEACRSGESFVLSASARVTVASKKITENFFMKIESSSGRFRAHLIAGGESQGCTCSWGAE